MIFVFPSVVAACKARKENMTVPHTTLTHAQIADAVAVTSKAMEDAGGNYVKQNFPFFESLATPYIHEIAGKAAINIINVLVASGYMK